MAGETGEKRRALISPRDFSDGRCSDGLAHEDEGGVAILIVLPCVASVKFFGPSVIDGEEVGAGIVGSRWFEEFLEGGVKARGS